MRFLALLGFSCLTWLAGSVLRADADNPATAIVAAEAGPQTAGTASPAPAPGAVKLQLNGREFVQVSKEEGAAARTYHYLPPGTSLDSWGEMVTHQIIILQTPAGADEVVQLFKRKAEKGFQIEPVVEGRKATVFVSLAHDKAAADSQVAVCFAFLGLADSRELHLIQYVIKPGQQSESEVARRLHSWKNLFKARAAAFNSN